MLSNRTKLWSHPYFRSTTLWKYSIPPAHQPRAHQPTTTVNSSLPVHCQPHPPPPMKEFGIINQLNWISSKKKTLYAVQKDANIAMTHPQYIIVTKHCDENPITVTFHACAYSGDISTTHSLYYIASQYLISLQGKEWRTIFLIIYLKWPTLRWLTLRPSTRTRTMRY